MWKSGIFQKKIIVGPFFTIFDASVLNQLPLMDITVVCFFSEHMPRITPVLVTFRLHLDKIRLNIGLGY